jgi:hypothetical protein
VATIRRLLKIEVEAGRMSAADAAAILAYVDDYMYGARTREAALQAREILRSYMRKINVALNDKSREPSQRQLVLGLILDTVKQTLELSPEKVTRYVYKLSIIIACLERRFPVPRALADRVVGQADRRDGVGWPAEVRHDLDGAADRLFLAVVAKRQQRIGDEKDDDRCAPRAAGERIERDRDGDKSDRQREEREARVGPRAEERGKREREKEREGERRQHAARVRGVASTQHHRRSCDEKGRQHRRGRQEPATPREREARQRFVAFAREDARLDPPSAAALKAWGR